MGRQGLTQILQVVQNTKESRCDLRVIGGLSILCGTKQGTAAIVIGIGLDIYLLTAGHVAGGLGTQVKCQGRVIGSVVKNFYQDAPPTDIAMVKLDKEKIKYGLDEIKVGDEIHKGVKLAASIPPENYNVVMASTPFPGEGEVLVSKADVTAGQETLKNVSIANYYSEESDSGAAVLTVEKLDRPILWGIHGGRIVVNNRASAWFTPIHNIPSF